MIETIYIAGGCFWGLEKILGELDGVTQTRVGYMGGQSENPNYVSVCTGLTGHAETVEIVFDDEQIAANEVLAKFFENHDPTQLNRQGNDKGTQYRSAIWTTTDAQFAAAEAVRAAYQERLDEAGAGKITTVIKPATNVPFWVAEEYHQKYLKKNPLGYCNHGFNGVACPSGIL